MTSPESSCSMSTHSADESTQRGIAILPDFDLKTVLETTPLGATIIHFYDVHKRLNHSKRSLLVDIICKRIFNYIVATKMRHTDYNILTAKIISLFPKECAGTYYVPAISKRHSVTNKPIISRGKLVDKVRNLLRLNRSIVRDKTSLLQTETDDIENEIAVSEAKMWLDTKLEPWDEVIEKWKKTFALRKCSKEENVDSFFKNWPILNDSRSLQLVCSFVLMFFVKKLYIFPKKS